MGGVFIAVGICLQDSVPYRIMIPWAVSGNILHKYALHGRMIRRHESFSNFFHVYLFMLFYASDPLYQILYCTNP